jgi:PAS domain-containing protein
MGDTFSTAGEAEFVAACANHPSKESLYDTIEFNGNGVFGEQVRYAAVESLQMLDTSIDEQPFNRITQLMTKVFKTPVSLITLVADPSRVWFKSKVGPFGACVDRDGSWCNYVLVPSTPEVLITEDASKDARFAHNPYVAGEPFIKFYAGAPLVGSRGERYGTLCIVDLKQRAYTAELYALLTNFAALAVEEIERNKPLYEIATDAATNDVERSRHLDLSVTAYKEGVIMMDVRESGWPISYANPSFETSSGLELDDLAGSDFWELFEYPGKDELDLASMIGKGETFELAFFCLTSKRWLTLRMMPATTDRFSPSKATGIPGWVPSVEAPKGIKLGLDVDDDKVVDIADRDLMEVPDSKCFWFAVVVKKWEVASSMGSTATGSQILSGSGSDGSAGGASVSSFGSGFGEYTPPASLGKLELGPLLGSGSFGKVYRSIADGKPVATKVIDCRGRDRGLTSEQMDEVRLACDLDHPQVIKVLQHGTSNEQRGTSHMTVAWIIQELCDMGQLSDAAERGWLRVTRSITAPPDMAVVLPTLRDIADAMSYVHSKSIIHADLTGRNVLLASSTDDPRGFTAKVGDFGLSQLTADGEGIHTSTLGTITHMPPELLTNKMLYPLADVWAFGIIAWEAYHGKKVYCGKLPPQIIMTVVKNIPLEWKEAPEEFVSLMRRVLAYECDGRPQFLKVVEELDKLIAMKLKVAIEPSEHLLSKTCCATKA